MSIMSILQQHKKVESKLRHKIFPNSSSTLFLTLKKTADSSLITSTWTKSNKGDSGMKDYLNINNPLLASTFLFIVTLAPKHGCHFHGQLCSHFSSLKIRHQSQAVTHVPNFGHQLFQILNFESCTRI